MPVKLRLFGVPQYLNTETEEWTPLPLDNRSALLIYLARANSWVSREQVAFLFWPDTDDASARTNLRQLISRSKKLPQAAELETTRTNLSLLIETDVQAFLQAKEAGDWQTALDIASAPFCEGLNDVSGGILEWLEHTRTSLNNNLNTIRHTYSQEHFSAGDYNKAAKIIEPLALQKPVSEDTIQAYLRCLYLAGKRDSALKSYQEFAEQLELDFGLEPLPETKALAATIEASDKSTILSRISDLASNKVNNQVKSDLPLVFLYPPKLIGRHDALEKLEAVNNQLVIIKGEAGIGKTRFVETVYPTSYSLRCEEGLQHIPYHPIVAFIRSQLLSTTLPDLGPYHNDLARLIPEISTDKEVLADPMAGQIRLIEAITRYFEGLNNNTIFIDDLQWADERTIEFIVFLAKRQTENGIKLVLTYRTSEASTELLQVLNSLDAATILELDVLSKTQLHSFIEEDIQLETPELNDFCEWLHNATGGNPMFVLELLKSLYESGSIKASKDTSAKLVLADFVESIQSSTMLNKHISERIAGLIHKRLERLSPEANRLLQSMAVASELSLQQLSSVAGLSDWTLIDAFEELEKAGFVTAESFKHDILREVTQQHLSTSHKQLLHRRVATMLTNDLDAAIIAEHWYAAGELDKAVAFWEIAVQKWVDVGLLHNATSILERLIKLETGKTLEHALQLANYYVHIGFYPKAMAIVDSLQDSAAIKAHHKAQMSMVFGMAKMYEGNIVEAEQHLAEAVRIGNSELAQELNPESIFYNRMQHALTKALLGDVAFSETTWETLVKEDNAKVPQSLKLNSYFLLAGSYARNNRIEEAKVIHDTKLHQLPDYLSYNLYFYLNYHFYKANHEQVAKLLVESKKLLTMGFQMGTPFILEGIIDAQISMGQFEEAEFHIDLLIEQKFPLIACAVWARQAKLFSLTNRLKEAQDSLTLALKTLETTGYADAIAVTVTIVLSFGDAELNKCIQEKIEMVRHLPILFHFKADLEKALEAYDGGLEPYQPAIYTSNQTVVSIQSIHT